MVSKREPPKAYVRRRRKRRTGIQSAARKCFVQNRDRCDCFLPSHCKLLRDNNNEQQAVDRSAAIERLRAARRKRSGLRETRIGEEAQGDSAPAGTDMPDVQRDGDDRRGGYQRKTSA